MSMCYEKKEKKTKQNETCLLLLIRVISVPTYDFLIVSSTDICQNTASA